MPDPSPINSQITGQTTQVNTKTNGDETPAQAMGNLYQQEEEGQSQDNAPEKQQ